MCGRFANAAEWPQYLELLTPHLPDRKLTIDPAAPAAYHARHNVGPGTSQPIVALAPPKADAGAGADASAGADGKGQLVLKPRHWGVHAPAGPTKRRMLINARAETVREGRMWAPMLRAGGRGVLFVQGFFERSDRTRAPYYFRPSPNSSTESKPATGSGASARAAPGAVLALGVVFGPEGFVIVTVPAAEWMRPIHDRQPLILDDAGVRAWLGLSDAGADPKAKAGREHAWVDQLQTRADPLEHYPVPPEVNNVRNDDPSFVQPLTQRKGGIESLFGKARARAQTKESPSAATDSGQTHATQGTGVKLEQGQEDKEERARSPAAHARAASTSGKAETDPAPNPRSSGARKRSASPPSHSHSHSHEPGPGPAQARTKRAKGLDRFFPTKSTTKSEKPE